jgi:4-amino-4-deoxy-L-arabinose transferase-like glycosyltransferase
MQQLIQNFKNFVLGQPLQRILILWIAIYAACIALTLNNTYPIQGDESYYTVSAANMVKNHSYMVPYYYGQPRFQKPVLTYWIVAASYKIFGISLWSGRIPMLIFSCLTLILLYNLSLLYVCDQKFGLFTVLLLSASFLFISFSRIAMNEPVLIFLTTCAMYAFTRADMSEKKWFVWLFFGWVCISAACMAKGPGPLLIPASYIAYLVVIYRKSALPKLGRLFNPAYLAIFAIITIPWYVYNYHYNHDVMLSIVKKESGHATTAFSPLRYLSHAAFYAYITFLSLFPFTVMAIIKKVRVKQHFSRRLVFPLVFCISTLAVFIFFVKEHKDRYIYSMLPALTVLTGAILYESRNRLRYAALSTAISLAILAVYVVYPLFPGEGLRNLVSQWQDRQDKNATISSYGLDLTRKGWVMLLSGGKAVIDSYNADYVITNKAGLDSIHDANIIARADERTGLVFSDKKLKCVSRTFFLTQRSNR